MYCAHTMFCTFMFVNIVLNCKNTYCYSAQFLFYYAVCIFIFECIFIFDSNCFFIYVSVKITKYKKYENSIKVFLNREVKFTQTGGWDTIEYHIVYRVSMSFT